MLCLFKVFDFASLGSKRAGGEANKSIEDAMKVVLAGKTAEELAEVGRF